MNSRKRECREDPGGKIAKILWPSLSFVSPGSFDDHAGIDAFDGADPVQVKYDAKMAETGNIYDEIYEKSKETPWQPWRNSTRSGKVKWFIFTTTNFGVRVAVDKLAQAEKGKRLTQINDTSMGFLIPLTELQGASEIKHLAITKTVTGKPSPGLQNL